MAERTRRTSGRPAVLHHRRPHPRATVVRRRRSHRAPPTGRRRRRQAALCPPPAAPRACHRTGPRGRAAEHHPTTARPHQPRHDVDLPARDRPRGDHRHRPHAAGADDCPRAPVCDSEPLSAGARRRSRSPLTNQAPTPQPSRLAPVVPEQAPTQSRPRQASHPAEATALVSGASADPRSQAAGTVHPWPRSRPRVSGSGMAKPRSPARNGVRRGRSSSGSSRCVNGRGAGGLELGCVVG